MESIRTILIQSITTVETKIARISVERNREKKQKKTQRRF